MQSLYLDRRDAVIDLEDGAIVVRVAGEPLGRVPSGGLERVVIRGAKALGTRLLAHLWERDVGLLVLSGRQGVPTARLLGRPHGDARIRMAQYALAQDPAARLEIARRIVAAKLHAQRRLLLRLAAGRDDARRHLLRSAERIAAVQAGCRTASTIDALLGYEGTGAAAHLEGLQAVVPPALGFAGRNRRPPRDPVNALLSLGYTLLHHEAARVAQIRGLDPMLGVLHEPAPGRDSLASDLIEPLRPHVDALVVDLLLIGVEKGPRWRGDRHPIGTPGQLRSTVTSGHDREPRQGCWWWRRSGRSVGPISFRASRSRRSAGS